MYTNAAVSITIVKHFVALAAVGRKALLKENSGKTFPFLDDYKKDFLHPLCIPGTGCYKTFYSCN